MTTQMTIRLSDEATEFIDQQVADGKARSRAAVVDELVRRAQRRERAAADAAIYAALPSNPGEEAAWAEWASSNAATVWADLD